MPWRANLAFKLSSVGGKRGVLIAQPVNQLHEERTRQDIVGHVRQQTLQPNRCPGLVAQDIVGESIGLPPSGLRLHHSNRDAPEVLDEQAAQHDRRSPELPQGQWPQALIAADIRAQRV